MSYLQECPMCHCWKLHKFFKVREKTGIIYKTCIECGVRSKGNHDKMAKDMKCSKCAYTTNHAGILNIHIKTVHDKIKDFECNIMW